MINLFLDNFINVCFLYIFNEFYIIDFCILDGFLHFLYIFIHFHIIDFYISDGKLTTEQRVLLVKLYYECANASEAARQMATKFGREAPNRSTVLQYIQRFEETGSVADLARSGHPSLVKDEEFKMTVKAKIVENKPTSSRRIA